jgi:hypothetical protein
MTENPRPIQTKSQKARSKKEVENFHRWQAAMDESRDIDRLVQVSSFLL